MNVVKYLSILVQSALLLSCNSAKSGSIDENGYQYISGYFIKEDAPKLCILRFHLESSSKRDIYQIIENNLPKFTNESEDELIVVTELR
jgi:hypothetical protein